MTTTIKLEMRLPTEETSCHSHNNQEKAEASDSLTLFLRQFSKVTILLADCYHGNVYRQWKMGKHSFCQIKQC